MSSQQLLAFAQSRPFIPYEAVMVGGRTIIVRHPEYAVAAFAGAGLWLIDDQGYVEAIDAGLILAIRTLNPTDPHLLTG